MSTAVSVESRIERVDVTDEAITAFLVDGRVISVPLAWSWRLSEATPKQRANWQLIGDGHGVHWSDIDEDISADGMLNGISAPRRRAQRPQRPSPANKALQPTVKLGQTKGLAGGRSNMALQPTSRPRRKAKSKRRSRASRG